MPQPSSANRSSTTTFQYNRKRIEELLEQAFRLSSEFPSSSSVMGEVSLLADRVIVALCDSPQSRAGEIAEPLEKCLDGDANDLLDTVERWLKGLLWLANRSRFDELDGNPRFNLFGVVTELGLLNIEEANRDPRQPDTRDRFDDEIRWLVFLAKELRNPATHDASRIDEGESDFAFQARRHACTAAIAICICGIYALRVELYEALEGLFVQPLASNSLGIDMIEFVKDERSRHLNGFAGRNAILETLQTKTHELIETGGYLEIIGEEGIGKSALCAKLSEILTPSLELGTHRISRAEREALPSWATGSLFLSGKVLRSAPVAAAALVAQANVLLLSPILLDSAPPTSESIVESSAAMRVAGSHRRAESATARRSVDGLEDEHQIPTFSETEATHKRYIWAPEHHCQLTVTRALERLVQERGHVVVIVDALDELTDKGRRLDCLAFLPPRLPKGVVCLLTTREIDGILRHVRTRFSLPPSSEIKLDGLTATEVGILGGQSAVDDLYKKTNGVPLYVREATRYLSANGSMDEWVPDAVASQLERWLAGNDRNSELRQQALNLLTVFEPIQPLPLDCIQGYLETVVCGSGVTQLTKRNVKDLLKPVEDQLNGKDQKKLAQRPLAEHVWTLELSQKDRVRVLNRVNHWLATDDDVDDDTLTATFVHWLASAPDDAIFAEAASNLLGLCLRNRSDVIVTVANRQIDGDGIAKDADSGRDWLEKAANTSCRTAMGALGRRLVDGDGLPKDVDAGHKWLVKAAETGEAIAMVSLGFRLSYGAGIPKDAVEGLRWLNKAAESKQPLAMHIVGILLLDGDGITKDVEAGREWLTKAAETGAAISMATLGASLIDGDGFPRDVDAGREWLSKAANAGDTKAMRILGTRLIDGYGITKDIETGREWLAKAADTGDTKAMRILGSRLIDGYGITKDVEAGREWLTKAIETGDTGAMGALGCRLIDGDGITKDVEAGREWLTKAIETGDTSAMVALGYRLIDGDGITKDVEAGREWLTKAAVTGDTGAMGALGCRLIDGDGITKDVEAGREWLTKAANTNDTKAMRILGTRLIEGYGITKDVEAGWEWLAKAADANDTKAMRILGYRLIDGDGITKDVEAGREWLTKAAGAGDTSAMVALGSRLIDGDGITKDVEAGREWLTKAAEAGDTKAMRILGHRLIDGDGITKDVEAGREWLTKAAEAGDTSAMVALGSRLIDGDGITKDVEAGIHWLTRAIDQGDGSAMMSLGFWRHKNGEHALAGRLFARAYALGESNSANNLAYMRRRNELPDDVNIRTVHELLAESVLGRDPFSVVNLALAVATGVDCTVDWEEAEALVADLASQFETEKMGEVTAWWGQLAQRDDPEGHVVLGWLTRHALAEDPDQMSPSKRFATARRLGWTVPEWLDRVLTKDDAT